MSLTYVDLRAELDKIAPVIALDRYYGLASDDKPEERPNGDDLPAGALFDELDNIDPDSGQPVRSYWDGAFWHRIPYRATATDQTVVTQLVQLNLAVQELLTRFKLHGL